MNAITALFDRKKDNVLSVFFTAGFPALEDTAAILDQLERSGADMIEIGMPFSDPLADGPVIQHSSEVALRNGMSIRYLFSQLAKVKRSKPGVPLILMGYLNPVLRYGVEDFCRDAASAGISGLILPDLPLEEYLSGYQPVFDRYGLKNIFLITPQTTGERIRRIDEVSDAFIYIVSSAGTTGVRNGIEGEKEDYFKRIRDMGLRNPRLIGFGISDNKSFRKACEYAHGAIIGSAFIRALQDKVPVAEFIKEVKRTG
ncbi:MAG: tryptophan synthase subunit alpha [Bacteroidota bacterium]